MGHGDIQLDDVLCMFRRAGWAQEELIAQVVAMPDELLARRLWQDWFAFDCMTIWITAFWEKTEAAAMLDFYTSPELYLRMEKLALCDLVSKETAEMASQVADVIRIAAPW